MLAPTGNKVPDPHKAPPRVPADARSAAADQGEAAGIALLTGDFNPIHWIRPYAQMAGFKSTILHGFGSLAICVEILNANVFSGDVNRLQSIDVRFTRRSFCRRLCLYRRARASTLAAAGGPTYLTGAYTHA